MCFNEPSKLDMTKFNHSKINGELKLTYSLPFEWHFNYYLAKQFSRWLPHLSWTEVTNHFPSMGFSNVLICSKVGIIRNEWLILWILSICKLRRIAHKLYIKAYIKITLKSIFSVKNAIILSLCTLRCYEHHNVVMDVITFPKNL